jgi:membrane associated rhomboid family serine protease
MPDALYDSPQQPRMTPAVQWLLAANIGVYFLQLTLFQPDQVYSALGLSVGDLATGWWTPFTYMFVHAGIWHLAFNMLALWMFGPRVEQSWNTRGFTYFYLWCGLGGAVAHLLLQRNAGLIGASAAVSGVLLAYAMRWPDEEVYLFGVIPMKTRWLIVWMVVINLAMGVASSPGSSGIGWFSHLGGLAFGWIYLRMASFGGLDNFRRWVSPVPDEPEDAFRAVPKLRPRTRERSGHGEMDEVVAKSNAVVTTPARSAPVPRSSDTSQQSAERLNLVLDKISRHGIESLTSEEVRLLEEMSRKLRDPSSPAD